MNKFSKIFLSLLFLGAYFFLIGPEVVNAVALQNPLGETATNPNEIIGNIIRAILGIVGSLALAVFIFGGFTWVISAGNEEKIKKGKDMILWATLGLVVIFFSYAMVTFVLGAIGGSSSSGQTIPNPSGQTTPNP